MRPYDFAMKELDVREWKDGHNPRIVAYFREVGHGWVLDDETAWCAAFVGAMISRAGGVSTGKLNARSYLEYGEAIDLKDAREGDLVIFERGGKNSWKGHVGFYAGQTEKFINVLGGNQRKDKVSIQKYGKLRLLGVRTSRVLQGNHLPTPDETPKPNLIGALVKALARLFRRK